MYPCNITAIMPMGKYKGRPVSTLPVAFLFWWLSQDAIRSKHQFLARAILAHLRDRLGDLAGVEAELLPTLQADGSDLV